LAFSDIRLIFAILLKSNRTLCLQPKRISIIMKKPANVKKLKRSVQSNTIGNMEKAALS